MSNTKKTLMVLGAAVVGVAAVAVAANAIYCMNQNMFIHWGKKKGSALRKKRTTTPLNISVKDNGAEAVITVPKFSLRQISKKLYSATDMTWTAVYSHKLPRPFRRIVLALPAIVPAQRRDNQHCIAMIIEADGKVHLQSYPSKIHAATKILYCDTEASPIDPIDCDEDVILPQDFVFSYVKAKK
jgi:hypothetical protein